MKHTSASEQKAGKLIYAYMEIAVSETANQWRSDELLDMQT